MTGTLISQIIAFSSIPIITRLYSPTEYSNYSIFIAIISIVGLPSCLKYDQAIVIPKSESEANSLFFLSLVSSIIICLIFTIVILLAGSNTQNIFESNDSLIYFIPLGIFLVSFLQLLQAYSNRHMNYSWISGTKILNSVTLSGTQLTSKFLMGLNGLVAGKLIADTLSIISFCKLHFQKLKDSISTQSPKYLLNVAKKYSNFAFFQTPTVLLNSISQNLPIFALALFFSAEIAGFYALTVRALLTPSSLISVSTREVYYKKASELFSNGCSFKKLYIKTTLGLTALFIPALLLINFFGPYLFSLVFGEEWKESGEIATILIWTYLFAFINPPSIATFSILNLQKHQLRVEIFSLLLRSAAFLIGYYIFNSSTISICLFVTASILINLYLMAFIYSEIKKSDKRLLSRT